MNRETMRRRGFSPYGPSKAALESATAIWAQDLAGSGITVNALLPGGATLTGMIPKGLPDSARSGLMSPEIVVAPLLWLCSDAAAAVTGKRLDARRWTGPQPAGAPGMTRSRMSPGRAATKQHSPDQPGPRPSTIAASSRRAVPSVAAPNDPRSSDRPTLLLTMPRRGPAHSAAAPGQ
ncbi:SDR family oxidoreductase [Novosphingobium guangzhouense]|uniref:SDR family oxidoreductase n=1 Tax=Novosphingobium guangzhouense TaxID=1850347 RepID=UPI003CCBB7AB